MGDSTFFAKAASDSKLRRWTIHAAFCRLKWICCPTSLRPQPATSGKNASGCITETLDLTGADVRKPVVDLEAPISFQLAASIPAELDFKQELLSLRSDAQRTIRLLGVLPRHSP